MSGTDSGDGDVSRLERAVEDLRAEGAKEKKAPAHKRKKLSAGEREAAVETLGDAWAALFTIPAFRFGPHWILSSDEREKLGERSQRICELWDFDVEWFEKYYALAALIGAAGISFLGRVRVQREIDADKKGEKIPNGMGPGGPYKKLPSPTPPPARPSGGPDPDSVEGLFGEGAPDED